MMKIASTINTLRMSWKSLFKGWTQPVGLFAIALSLVFLFNACTLGANPSLKPFRIGITAWPGYDISRYAQTSGIFKQRGLEVEFVQLDNPYDTARAAIRGGVDAAFTTFFDLMVSDPGNGIPVALLAIDISAGSDGIVTQPGIKSVAELRGKKVGVHFGGSTHLTLLEALKANQIDPSEVKIIDYTLDVAAQKLEEGALDAAALWEPLVSQAAEKTKGNVIHTTKQIDSLIIDLLISNSKNLQAKKAELKQFMLAWFDVMHAVETQPEKVFAAVAKQLGQSSESFARDYAGVKKGDIALNQRLFAPEGRLQSAKSEIIQLLKVDRRHGRVIRSDVEIDATLVNEAIAGWKP